MIGADDFGGDEMLCLALAFVIACEGWMRFYFPIFSISLLGRSVLYRLVLASVPILGLSISGVVLCQWADVQVVGHANYIFLFVVVGAAFSAISFRMLAICGISIRNDVIDRNNPAALAVCVGAILATAIIYALANVGGGPTIWTTILPAAQSAIVLFLLALVLEFAGSLVFESVAVDRDVAAGIRVGGALVGCGIVLGRSAGGVWISSAQSLIDLARFGWPALIIALAASFVHRKMRPTAKSPKPPIFSGGIFPAIAFVLAGICAVYFMPHGFHLLQW